jgi:hypothetical protein
LLRFDAQMDAVEALRGVILRSINNMIRTIYNVIST